MLICFCFRSRCKDCKTVFHLACKAPLHPCPRCQRIRKYLERDLQDWAHEERWWGEEKMNTWSNLKCNYECKLTLKAGEQSVRRRGRFQFWLSRGTKRRSERQWMLIGLLCTKSHLYTKQSAAFGLSYKISDTALEMF